MSTWIDLENIFDNRQGFGTELNIEECLHESTDVIITNDLYQQLISALNKYYNETDQIVTDLNNNVNFVKNELEITNENVRVNRESIQNILSDLITIRNNIQTNANNISNNHNEINDLNTLIASLNTQINNVNSKYNYLKQNVWVVTNDSELRSALKNKIPFIIIKSEQPFQPTESYLIPENTIIKGINNPIFDCSFSDNLNNVFRNDLKGNESEYNGVGNIIIDGLNFVGNNTTKAITCITFAHGANIQVRNCSFNGFNNWHNIELCGCRNAIIEQNYFTNFGLNSPNPTEVIQLDLPINNITFPWTCHYDSTPCKDIIIRNNYFDSIATSTGAIGQHSYKEGKRHENILIENNKLNNIDNFIYLLGCKNLRVIKNYGENVFNFMYTGGTSNNQYCNTEVIGNHIYFKQNYNVKPPEPSGYTGKFLYPVLNSTATRTEDTNIIIKDNIIVGCKDHAITTVCNSVFISNNYISNCGKCAIYIWGGNKVFIQGNIVHQMESVNIMLGGNNNIKTERCICVNNVATIGTGVNYISSTSFENNNIIV